MRNIKVNFKHRHLRAQWAKLLIVNPKLVYITLFAFDQVGGSGTLTEIFRTKKMQLAYYPNRAYKLSVHQLWRGDDIRTWVLTDSEAHNLVFLINQKFPYGKGNFKTAKYHTIGRGHHIHLQTKSVYKLK